MSVPGWNCSLISAAPWMILRLDVLDAVDVEEVILVVVGDEPFHLGRVHAAVGLGDVERRHAEVGEDVARHACRASTPASTAAKTRTSTVTGLRSAIRTSPPEGISPASCPPTSPACWRLSKFDNIS